MKCEFVVGQKVVCVKKGAWSVTIHVPGSRWDKQTPVYGEVCEITKIGPCNGSILIALVGYNDGYDASRFRPLVEPDISVFNAILADINAGKVKPVVVPA